MIEEVMGLAHYYQFEYYNIHLNATFILTSSCPKDEIGLAGAVDCVPPAGGLHVLTGDTMFEECRKWEGSQLFYDKAKLHDDEFCYKPHLHHGDDYIKFNKQKRNLGQHGSQGPVWKHKMETEKVCEGLCRVHLDADLLRDDVNYFPSHQVIWNDLGMSTSEMILPITFSTPEACLATQISHFKK